MPELDETKRLLLALALSAAVFLLWTVIFPPKPPPKRAEPPVIEEEAPAPVEPAVPEGPAQRAEGEAEEEASAPITGEEIHAEGRKEVRVDTGVATVVLVNRGACPISWTLPAYEGYEGKEPVDLVDRRAFSTDRLPLQFELPQNRAAVADTLNHAFWTVEEEASPGGRTIRFRFADGRGVDAEKTLAFEDGSYLVEVGASLKVDGRPVPFSLAWGPGIANHPAEVRKNRYFQRPRVVTFSEGSYERWSKPDDSPELRDKPVRWAGMDDQYFAALFTPPAPTTGFRYTVPTPEDKGKEKGKEKDDKGDYPALVLEVPFPAAGQTVHLYAGPKQLQILGDLGPSYTRIIEFGTYVGFIAKGLLYALVWIHKNLVSNYGWGIILLTVLIRLLFFPLTQTSMRKMRGMSEKMKRVQPQQKAIKEKYKGVKDVRKRQKMNDEMMALYRKEGINPADQLSGCLPMVLQMPIFFAFFRMLPAAIEIRKEPWILWIRDLSQHDPYFVTPLLMGAAMFFSTRRSMSQQPGASDGLQKQMFYIMPVMFTVICLWAPSGLVLYWLFSNLIQLGQQEILRRGLAAEGEKGGASKREGKGSNARARRAVGGRGRRRG